MVSIEHGKHQMAETSDKDQDSKSLHYYAQCVAAWFNTKLERDKSLLALSTGGIGLLVTLIMAVGVKSIESLILYCLSLLGFIICIIIVLIIFNANATLLESVINNKKPIMILGVLDRIAIYSFIFALATASILGISTAFKKTLMEEVKMTKTTDSFKNVQAIGPNYQRATGSFDKAQNIGPVMSSQVAPEAVKSFNGAQNIGPATQQSGTQQSGTQQTGTQMTSGQSGSSAQQDSGSSAKK